MIIGGKSFDTLNNTYLMGILNVTGDSFSDGGKYNNIDAALFHARKMVEEGADIIDVGGESTRPGAKPVSAAEEMERVLPVIELIKKNIDIPISLDTYKASVAREGIKAGVDMINDIWGLTGDDKIAGVIKENNVSVVIMHNSKCPSYHDLPTDVVNSLMVNLDIAHKAGISDDKIILDPGIGFAKNTDECLELINSMDVLKKALDYPWMMAASRKSVIGNTLKLPVEERLEGTLAITTLACDRGFSFVRVHDVSENRRVIDFMKALKEKG